MDRALFWYSLFNTPGVGPKTLLKIATAVEGYNLRELPPDAQIDELMRLPEVARILREHPIADHEDEFQARWNGLQELGVKLIYPGVDQYAQQLLVYCDKFGVSPVLFARGCNKLLSARSIAVVGSRAATDQTLEITSKIAYDLAGEGFNIVSGYAKGVDTAAHLGALEAGGTTTLALSHGILQLTTKPPLEEFNWDSNVLALSQFSPDDKWHPGNAFARNRLICALSTAVLVIEAGPERDSNGKMSGTYDTAKVARRMGIPVFVLDHAQFGPQPQGNASLIETGGIVVEMETAANAISKYLATNVSSDRIHRSKDSETQLSLFRDSHGG
ncbi:MAG: DNA-processing protein DprA [Candidatus Zixiibacteriota bacterium]